ncbi:hypothetical protein MBLNU230_g8208t1 [Neophaeotheca triangularis]
MVSLVQCVLRRTRTVPARHHPALLSRSQTRTINLQHEEIARAHEDNNKYLQGEDAKGIKNVRHRSLEFTSALEATEATLESLRRPKLLPHHAGLNQQALLQNLATRVGVMKPILHDIRKHLDDLEGQEYPSPRQEREGYAAELAGMTPEQLKGELKALEYERSSSKAGYERSLKKMSEVADGLAKEHGIEDRVRDWEQRARKATSSVSFARQEVEEAGGHLAGFKDAELADESTESGDDESDGISLGFNDDVDGDVDEGGLQGFKDADRGNNPQASNAKRRGSVRSLVREKRRDASLMVRKKLSVRTPMGAREVENYNLETLEKTIKEADQASKLHASKVVDLADKASSDVAKDSGQALLRAERELHDATRMYAAALFRDWVMNCSGDVNSPDHMRERKDFWDSLSFNDSKRPKRAILTMLTKDWEASFLPETGKMEFSFKSRLARMVSAKQRFIITPANARSLLPADQVAKIDVDELIETIKRTQFLLLREEPSQADLKNSYSIPDDRVVEVATQKAALLDARTMLAAVYHDKWISQTSEGAPHGELNDKESKKCRVNDLRQLNSKLRSYHSVIEILRLGWGVSVHSKTGTLKFLQEESPIKQPEPNGNVTAENDSDQGAASASTSTSEGDHPSPAPPGSWADRASPLPEQNHPKPQPPMYQQQAEIAPPNQPARQKSEASADWAESLRALDEGIKRDTGRG